MTQPKLKPCPFCGAKGCTFQIPENTPEENAEHPEWRWRDAGFWVIGCWTEGCFGNINHKAMVFMNEEQAAETWNRRRRRI